MRRIIVLVWMRISKKGEMKQRKNNNNIILNSLTSTEKTVTLISFNNHFFHPLSNN